MKEKGQVCVRLEEKDKASVVKESLLVITMRTSTSPYTGILGINLYSEFNHIVDKTDKCHNC